MGVRGMADPCNDDHKVMPSLAVAAWVVMSVAAIALVATVLTNDSPNSQTMHIELDAMRGSLDYLPALGAGNKTTPCPEEFKRKFYADSNKINHPVIRALRMQGWQKSDSSRRAQVIWTYSATPKWYDRLEPWHRYNHMPFYKLWNSKDHFVTYMMKYGEATGKGTPLNSRNVSTKCCV
jgi:hypothetical protein